MAEDWDNLIILDACRFDVFEEEHHLPGDLTSVYSNASHTAEFVERNLRDDLSDTVYVSASPQIAKASDNFYHIEHLWDSHWDDEIDSVHPRDVTNTASKIGERYTDKRLIVHYMQPHYPFIGPSAGEIADHATFTGGLRNKQRTPFWDLIAAGTVDVDVAKRAYRENLQVVLPHVEQLAETLTGKTVVTSDHGNLFNSKPTCLPLRIEGHPRNYPAPELIEIPWLELPYERRRTIIDGNRKEKSTVSDSTVDDRLTDLGYLP